MGLTIRTSDIRKAINEVINSRKAQQLIKEAMYKKLPGYDEEFPKFMGRRPKSIKARIERIHKRCNEYGLSSQKFHDDAWAAVGFYKRVIESLGYEVEIWVEKGGYCDYDPQDHMPRSKQYEIRITADDGMVIEGYIKCMAAGSVNDPFDAYDTMMSLWPKPKRSYNESVKMSDLRNLIRESLRAKLNEWDSDDPDEGPEDDAYRESPQNEFDGIYDLDTGDIFEYENAPVIEIDNDEFGGAHKYVHFLARPDDYDISSKDDTYDSPGYWDCSIKRYDISADDKVYLTTVYEDSGMACYDDETPSEDFGGFSEEQKNAISQYVDENCDSNYWEFR